MPLHPDADERTGTGANRPRKGDRKCPCPARPPPLPSPAPPHRGRRGSCTAGQWAPSPRPHRPLSILPKRNRSCPARRARHTASWGPGRQSPQGTDGRPRDFAGQPWAGYTEGTGASFLLTAAAPHRPPRSRWSRDQVTPPSTRLRKDLSEGGFACGAKSLLGRDTHATHSPPCPAPPEPPGPCSPSTLPLGCQPRPCLPRVLGRPQPTAALLTGACPLFPVRPLLMRDRCPGG